MNLQKRDRMNNYRIKKFLHWVVHINELVL